MFWSSSNSSKRKGKERLFKQWVEHGDLSPEQAQADLLADELGEKDQLADEATRSCGLRGFETLSDRDRTMSLPIRYVFVLLAVIAVLMIALSVVLTVLIMRS
ncbi:hypothetical protein ACFLV5_02345 [Chloroflexota bacterium]